METWCDACDFEILSGRDGLVFFKHREEVLSGGEGSRDVGSTTEVSEFVASHISEESSMVPRVEFELSTACHAIDANGIRFSSFRNRVGEEREIYLLERDACFKKNGTTAAQVRKLTEDDVALCSLEAHGELSLDGCLTARVGELERERKSFKARI